MKKLVLALGFAAVLLVSCNNEPSLQKYFVENAGEKGFAVLDIAPNFINADSLNLSAKEKEALQSLRKLNVLVYRKDSLAPQAYDTQKTTVKGLLKEKQYEQLMKFGSGSEGMSIYTVGEDSNLDEFVMFMYQKESGFGVIRVLGDDMNPNNIMEIAQVIAKGGIDMKELKPLQDLMKK